MEPLVILVFLACSLNTPTACEEQQLTVPGTVNSCNMLAQISLANWVREHPNVGIRRWECRPPAARQTPI